jgi:hemerythrin-like domain-containing protein
MVIWSETGVFTPSVCAAPFLRSLRWRNDRERWRRETHREEASPMLIGIGQRTDHGFAAPLGLMSDCHRRIERFLAVLVTITRARQGRPLPDADRAAFESALRYFATAAPNHTADEEESLFPRLRQLDDPKVRAAIEAVDQLEADHRVADHHHAAVETLGRRWLEAGALPVPDCLALGDHLAALERLYRRHIKIEDEQLFPAARRALPAETIAAVGREMAERRKVPFEPPAGLAG